MRVYWLVGCSQFCSRPLPASCALSVCVCSHWSRHPCGTGKSTPPLPEHKGNGEFEVCLLFLYRPHPCPILLHWTLFNLFSKLVFWKETILVAHFLDVSFFFFKNTRPVIVFWTFSSGHGLFSPGKDLMLVAWISYVEPIEAKLVNRKHSNNLISENISICWWNE